MARKPKDEVQEEVVQGQEQETEAQEVEVKESVQYVLDNGEPTSRAGYIRQEFQKDRSRKDIAEELGVRYNIVFSATANMFNEAHPEGGGRVGTSAMAEDPRTNEVRPRKDIIRELYAEGWTRGEIAIHFEIAYGTVYGATKDVEPPEGSKARAGGKVMITHPETGEQVARVDFIREKFEEGWTRRQIADAAGCDYSVVWMATKEQSDDAEAESAEADVPDQENEGDADL